MAYIIVLGKMTEYGKKNIKESPKRANELKSAIEKVGSKLLGFYYTLGEYDFVAVIEQGSASDETVMGLAMAEGSEGTANTTTLKAFSVAEVERIIAGLP